MARIMLYFGSFNPVHNGHTSVARYVVEKGECDQLWFVVSPRNPLKQSDDLAPDTDRLEMTRIAVRECLSGEPIKVSDVEFSLPKPSYTIDTLRYLSGQYPEYSFSLLAGMDILEQIDRWKDYEQLLRDYHLYIYPREGYSEGRFADMVTILKDAPTWDYSSTDIRRALMSSEDVSGMIAPGVERYIKEHGLWRPDDAGSSIEEITREIEQAPSASLYMERGRLYKRGGDFGKALNDFLKVKELEPGNIEAQQYITMLCEIFAFRYLDYYNP